MQRILQRNSIILGLVTILLVILIILSNNSESNEPEAKTDPEISVPNTESVEHPRMRVSDLGITAGASALTNSFRLIRLSDAEESSEIEVTVEDYDFENIGYSLARLNIRTEPSLISDIKAQYYYNEEIHYSHFDEDWAVVECDGELSYVSKSYISEEPLSYVTKSVSNDARKSFEDYRKISQTSVQGRMQNQAETSPSGLRKVHNRYCIAVGSYFSRNVGQYVDVVLANGTVIPCIIGDTKADIHTSDDNSIGGDGSCIEFIVDTPSLPDQVMTSGDCSHCKADWNSQVVEIRLYDYDCI